MAITSSSGINRFDPVEVVAINLERIGGTLTLANVSSFVAGFFKITAKLSERPEM